MPHLVERNHTLIGAAGGRRRFPRGPIAAATPSSRWVRKSRRVGKLAGFATNPVQDGNIADAENAGNAAKAHVAHGIEQQRQSLHPRWLASGRRRSEIASTRLASIALHVAHDTILHIIARTAALAADIRHGGLAFPLPPTTCQPYG